MLSKTTIAFYFTLFAPISSVSMIFLSWQLFTSPDSSVGTEEATV